MGITVGPGTTDGRLAATLRGADGAEQHCTARVRMAAGVPAQVEVQ
jgi:hypothetical protein